MNMRHPFSGVTHKLLRSAATASLLIFCVAAGASPSAAQTPNACEDPADAPFHACLVQLGRYTQWMVVPGGNKGDLQDAIDDLYTTIRGEWTTSLMSQTHVKVILVWIPTLLAVYAAIILITGRIRPPRLRTSGTADW